MKKIQAMHSLATIALSAHNKTAPPETIIADLTTLPINVLHQIQEETAQAIDELNTTDDDPT